MGTKATGILLLLGLLIAIERFYQHPTYGNGLRAAVAAMQAGEFLV
jgi:hypothetical protein